MIGIDLTRISRFQKMDLQQLSRHLGQECNDATTAAKIWACRESIIKAENHNYPTNKIKIIFKKNHPPIVSDPDHVLQGPYMLSLSHEGDYLIAVALRAKNWSDPD